MSADTSLTGRRVARTGAPRSRRVGGGVLRPRQLITALPAALGKFDPRTLWRNPVMFVTEVGAVLTLVMTAADPSLFGWLITAWLWMTVLFGNLAEAVAESRGRAQADTLRRTKQQTSRSGSRTGARVMIPNPCRSRRSRRARCAAVTSCVSWPAS